MWSSKRVRGWESGVPNAGCDTTDLQSANNPHSKGFTLVEIVITIVLIGIISGIAAMIILQGVRAYSDEQSRSEVHYQARLAMERMAREIRSMRWNTALAQADITTMNPTDVRYTDIQGNQMGFRLNIGNLLERTQDNGATWQTLATGVTALNINYFRQDGVIPAAAATLWILEITMTDVQGMETLQMRTRVHPRNF
jgi:prepilin-type N-terminal cleavage/methylation domain-containing protein